MGIQIETKKSGKPATLSLLNHISFYLFEQEFGEFKGQSKTKAQAFINQLSKLLKQ